ncbi:hypothetical protein KY284_011452 [Solanum tuberosum]|nr:hypothetical protein KY284_011452 [Solanum tuberosum]
MASQKVITVITTSSDISTGDSHPPANCPKGHCLCSPTTHRGSFRYHRTSGETTSTAWFKRSKSMPVNKNNNNNNNLSSISPKSVEST